MTIMTLGAGSWAEKDEGTMKKKILALSLFSYIEKTKEFGSQ